MKLRLLFLLSAIFLFAGTVAAQTSTTTALTAVTPSPSVFGQSVTLSAQVAPAGASGSVAFMDGALMLGAAPLNGSGVAQMTTIAVSAGTHSLRAVYGGDGSYLLSQSTAQSYVVDTVPGGGFSSAVNFAVGSSPVWIAASDFNGDGKADLATVNRGGNSISILLGNGNGTFQSAVDYAVGTSPGFLVVADFNGDGRPDVAVANSGTPGNYGNTVSILIGNGDGTFQGAATITVSTNPMSMAVGDFNGDGRADLAVADYIVGALSVLLGNGNGTFQTAVHYTGLLGGAAGSVAIGDFNGDGNADLAIGSVEGSGRLSVMMGNGDGTFQNPVIVGFIGGGPPKVAVGDFNGDGRSDIAISTNGSFIQVLLGNGNGTFQLPFRIANTTGTGSPALSDFNGDGRTDLAVASFSGTTGGVDVWLGNGNGKLDFKVNYSTGTQPSSIALADFNGDGRPDAAVGNINTNNVSVILGTADVCCRLSIRKIGTGIGILGSGGGTVTSNPAGLNCGTLSCSAVFSPGQVVHLTYSPPTIGTPSKIFFAAWSGDADCSDGIVTMNAAMVCTARIDLPQPNLSSLRGDFNGDGNSDILWQHTDGSSALWLMNGLSLSNGEALPGPGTGWTIRLRGDFNGDGRSDILWQHSDGSTAISLGNGLNTAGVALLIGPGTGWSAQQVGDFNGDGNSDIVWQHTDGSMSIWLMNGLTMIGGAGLLGPGTGWSVRGIGDFNLDGKSDILWHQSDGSTAIWLMDGLSRSGDGASLLPSGTGWVPTQIGDFNGDGNSDILWQHSDGTVALWLFRGGTLDSGAALLGPGTGWTVTQVGDFDGDGNADILWQHSDGSIAVWLMNGLGPKTSALLLGPGTGWSPVRIGDFDGDGNSDILWRHSDGSVAAWLMDGTTISAAGELLGPGTGWSPAP